MESNNQDIREDEVIVTLGVFSGRPNPALNLDRDDAEKLAVMLHSVIGKETMHPPPHPKLGEFYGFFLKVPGELSEQLVLPRKMRVFSGVLTEEQDGEQKHWRDAKRIEEFLTVYAYEKGLGEFLELVGVKSPSSDTSAR